MSARVVGPADGKAGFLGSIGVRFMIDGEEPCRILEIIAPAGFEHFFEELVAMGGALQADPEELATLCERYALEMQPDSVPGLLERFGLRIGEPT